MYFPKPSLNENDLAIIERGDTAAHSIEAGQYVSWQGKTGKAKAAILQGATLSSSLFDYDDEGALNALNASLIKVAICTKTNVRCTNGAATSGSYYRADQFNVKTMTGFPETYNELLAIIPIGCYQNNDPSYNGFVSIITSTYTGESISARATVHDMSDNTAFIAVIYR